MVDTMSGGSVESAAPRRVLFRADAARRIGTGHVMRCLTLAEVLRRGGAECHFACRLHDGNLCEAIAARGFIVHALDVDPVGEAGATGETGAGHADPFYADWLGASVAADRAAVAAICETLRPDWIVADHYAIDARWSAPLRETGARIAVIDDLADRHHDCDLLMDQTFGCVPEDYARLVPAGCAVLTGAPYALLRPEFAAARAEALARREDGPVARVLVTMGGADIDNTTGDVLAMLAAPGVLPPDARVTAVMGGGAPHLDRVRAQAAALPARIEVLAGSDRMAALMAEADLAIGAAGSTSWERCCLGLPTAMVVTAPNQRRIADGLAAAGATVTLGDIADPGWRTDAPARLAALVADGPGRAAMAQAAAAVIDGGGAARVAAAMAGDGFHLRPAIAGDAPRVWDWRYAGGAERFYRTPGKPPLPAHVAWFDRALRDPRHLLLIGVADGVPVSHIRLDRASPAAREAEIGICVDASAQGRRIASRSIEHAAIEAARMGVETLTAATHADNAASVRLFRSLGFAPSEGHQEEDGPFLTWHRPVRPGTTPP